MGGELAMKQASAASWTDVAGREALLVQRCAAGDEDASALLVAEHHRMVFGLASHLLGDRDEALDLTQEVFLRVFRTLQRFRGQFASEPGFTNHVKQVRKRQRWWRDASVAIRSRSRSTCHDVASSVGRMRGAGSDVCQSELAGGFARPQRLPSSNETAIGLRELEGWRYERMVFMGLAIVP